MSCPKPSCSQWGGLQANPDIAGIGVLVAFGASAYLTLAFCTAYYLVDGDTAEFAIQRESLSPDRGSRHAVNLVDQMFKEKLAHMLTKDGHLGSKRWGKALHDAVLQFSDQQSLMGIAILVSGFSQLNCSLAVYHWQLTFDLAWFSSITHLTTLTCLRRYFHDRPALRIWRLSLMAITAVILSVALFSTGFINEFYTDIAFPAWCLYHPKMYPQSSAENTNDEPQISDYNGWYTGIAFGLLVFSYVSRIIQLMPAVTDIACKRLPKLPSTLKVESWLDILERRALNSNSTIARVSFGCAYRLLLSLFTMLRATTDLWTSLLFEITWLLVALIWGTIRIVFDRLPSSYSNVNASKDSQEENLWGFGQIMAVILLLLPINAFFEISYEALFVPTETSHFLRPDKQNNYQMVPPLISQDEDLSPLITESDPIRNTEPGLSSRSSRLPDYNHRWLCKLLLLIYCFYLVVAGWVLYVFPATGAIKELKTAGPALFTIFGIIFAFDVAIVWGFALIGISSLKSDPMPELAFTRSVSQRLSGLENRIKNHMTRNVWTWTTAITWNCLVLGLSSASAGIGYAVLSRLELG